jgi:ankyrin repeat protein
MLTGAGQIIKLIQGRRRPAMATPAIQMLAAVLAGDTNGVAALLDGEPQLCNLTDTSPDRLSVLHYAARRGYLAVVELLLAAGATPDKRSHDGSTPLHEAAAGGHLNIVRLLVEAGADADARTNRGDGPWAAANYGGQRAVAAYLRGLLVNG